MPLIGAILFLSGCGGGVVAEVSREQIGNRSFDLVDPSNVSGAAPLVLALHGAFGNSRSFRRALPLETDAARRGFRVAYLNGTGRRNGGYWNAGSCCGDTQSVNDVGYIDSVIGTLRARGLVSSVSLVGHSNGGMMVYRYLCEGGTPIASAMVISGSKMVGGACRLQASTRFLALHGTADANVPVDGGRGVGPSGARFKSLPQSVDEIAAAGANAQLQLLPGTGHKMSEVSAGVSREGNAGLSDFVAGFLIR